MTLVKLAASTSIYSGARHYSNKPDRHKLCQQRISSTIGSNFLLEYQFRRLEAREKEKREREKERKSIAVFESKVAEYF